jgi:hypothetical protein
MRIPRILIRPDDREEFIEVRPGYFSLKKSLKEFPNNLHQEYPEALLKEKAFAEKKTIKINQYWIEAYPEMFWEIPYGDKVIRISDDPYEGLTVKFKEKEKVEKTHDSHE